MRYEYERDAMDSRKIEAKKLAGLSDKINLKFDNCYLRVYKSEDNQGYFYCTLAIPTFTNDEGYVLELDFSDYFQKDPEPSPQDSRYYEPQYDPEDDVVVNVCEYEPEFELGDSFFETYSASCCGMSFSDLASRAVFLFEERIERNQHTLLLTLKITGTPYYGCAYLARDLYKKNT